MKPNPHFSRQWQEAMERKFAAQHEAEELLQLIAAEFQSDPTSVQCFDLRVVERVNRCAKELRETKHVF